ncbi:MAG: VWA domain-containing protein [Gammaproteobacteria bacterium]|nr:VWA domain-containing protein [Gammaproteobacteria bacterium]
MTNSSEQNDFVLEDTLLDRLLGFLQHLRSNGFHLGIQEELDVMKIADSGALLQQKRLRWGLRALLCSCTDDWQRFDRLFDTYWKPANSKREQAASYAKKMDSKKGLDGGQPGGGGEAAEADHAEEGDDSDAGDGGSKGGASLQESFARSDFRQLSDESQMREMELLVERMAKKMRRRMTRRQRLQRQGSKINLRKTIRNSLRYGGTPLELAFMKRKQQAPRLILLLDVSRSMSLYSFLFLRFARGIVEAFKDADAFVYHTRLVHVTDALRERDMTKAKEKLALMSSGWSGGTRIGECLQMFNRDYGRRIVNSRSIVMIVSDGYDTGEPQQLTQELQQLKQRARKIVWLNPLLGRDGYEPIAEGMKAALPLLDLFASAHNLESLMKLESSLMKL